MSLSANNNNQSSQDTKNFSRKNFKMKAHHWLLLALITGAVAGSFSHAYFKNDELQFITQNIFHGLSQIFLRSLFMVVVPMLFSALVCGVFDLGKSHGLGRVVSKTLLYTLLASSASVIIGISLVNVIKPGQNVKLDAQTLNQQATTISQIKANADQAPSAVQTIIELIPKNPLASAVKAMEGEMLQLMIFALMFGIALSLTLNSQGQADSSLISLLEEVYKACMHIVHIVMKIAPLAVFALVFNTAYKFGPEIFVSVLGYVLVVVLGLALQQFVVYSFLLKSIAKRNPIQFFKQCQDVYLYAFSTASSNATLPESLNVAENKLKINKDISKFVLTIGSTANQNGTALFEGITVLFLAQVYNIDLTIAQQAQVVFMSILAGIGTAGVPGGSLPLIMILLQSVGVPAEGLGLILGVDRFLDMCRTTLNVSGDLVIAAMVDPQKNT